MSSPSLAERARTAVASARVAGLVTYPRLGHQDLSTVSVSEDAGALVLCLPSSSPAAANLALRPLGTVRVAPADCETVTIQGAVRRLFGTNDAGFTRFRLDVGAVRLGGRATQTVSVAEYWAAAPDPLRDDAPGILAHLRSGHGRQLTACLRANGHSQALWVEARRLDRHGLEVVMLDEAGVSIQRLPFPTPVNRVQDLAPRLSVALMSRGRCADCPKDCPR